MARSCFFTDEYVVHVANNLYAYSKPMVVHCASADDDLGNHTLSYQKDFNWSFCEQLFHRTLFFCHIWWGSKSVAFDVFTSKNRRACTSHVCYWEAQHDGIYFSGYYPPKDLILAYSW
ncbi:hypothetical protein Pfo_026605 [Paulownia fortunei]|nr:hypothetical protein Pfo_026605 [Paulownia fortunei]